MATALRPLPRVRPRPRADIGRRANSVTACLVAFMVLVVGMLVRLQVVSPDRYVARGIGQRTVTYPIVGLRGAILDRNGEPLAMSLPAKAVVADPREVKNPELAAATLAPILGLDASVIRASLERPDTRFSYVARQLDPEIGAQVAAARIGGLTIIDETRRVEAADDLALSVLGRMDPFGEKPAFGLEKALDDRLRGQMGERTYERGGRGATIVGSERVTKAPVDGSSVTLTLDRSMQFWAEAALEEQVAKVGAAGGTAIVGRPSTGEILAMASVVNVGGDVRPSKLNLAVRTYEPGSVLKVVTAAAGFEQGVVEPDTVFTVPREIQVGAYRIRDAEPHPTKEMTVTEILAESSNVGTIKVAQLLGREKILTYLDRFRLGKMTNLGLDKEQAGQFRREWYGSDIGSIPIGQSITTTPLQIWNIYNAIANGGVFVAPRLIDSWTDREGNSSTPRQPRPERVLSIDAARKVTQALQLVIEEGTGRKWSIPGYHVAAKTGTAYEPIGGGRGYGGPGNRHYAASFAGFFPASNPQVSIMVMIDDPQVPNHTGARAAGPVFDRLARESMRLLGIPGDAVDSVASPDRPVRAQAATVTTVPPTTSTTLAPAPDTAASDPVTAVAADG